MVVPFDHRQTLRGHAAIAIKRVEEHPVVGRKHRQTQNQHGTRTKRTPEGICKFLRPDVQPRQLQQSQRIIVFGQQRPRETLVPCVSPVRPQNENVLVDIRTILGGFFYPYPFCRACFAFYDKCPRVAGLHDVNRSLRLLFGQAQLEPRVSQKRRMDARTEKPRDRLDNGRFVHVRTERLLEFLLQDIAATMKGKPLCKRAHR